MTGILRGTRTFLVGLVMAVGLVSAAVPASADSLTLAVLCESGTYHFSCDLNSVSGGVAPYSYLWVALDNATITSSNTSDSVSGICGTGSNFHVRLTVTDSLGASGSVVRGPICRSGPWP